MRAAKHSSNPSNVEAYLVRECENDNFIMTSWGKDLEIQNIFKENNVSPNVKYTTYDTPATLAMVRMAWE